MYFLLIWRKTRSTNVSLIKAKFIIIIIIVIIIIIIIKDDEKKLKNLSFKN